MGIVAILTPHYAHNYGAQLQAFALGQAIKKLGFQIEYINRRPDYYFSYSNAIDRFQKRLQLKTEGKGFLDFEEKYIQPQSIRIIDNNDYNQLDISKYQAIVVGSDQIWRDDYFYHSFEYSPYLYFVKDEKIKKISYAASFGKDTCNHPEDRRLIIENLLKDFTDISVREISGVKILKEVFHIGGTWVADPTLLHNADFYIKSICLKKEERESDFIVTYILGSNSRNIKIVNSLADKLGIPAKHIYKRSMCKLAYKRPFSLIKRFRKVPTVFEWLNLILNAKYVFTDSFHGMVFCILFKKQFVVMNNKAGGTERFTSLLNRLGLIHRLCEWEDPIVKIQGTLFKSIDYDAVESSLDEFRKHSFDFLKNALYE